MVAWLTLIDPIGKLLDKLIPDKEAAAKAKLELLKSENEQVLQEMQAAMSAIIAEANSTDKWTSRARPSFLYVFYLIIMSLVIVAPIIGVFAPQAMTLFFGNVADGFKAIPEALWNTFAIGYLGYAGSRSWEKVKGVAK